MGASPILPAPEWEGSAALWLTTEGRAGVLRWLSDASRQPPPFLSTVLIPFYVYTPPPATRKLCGGSSMGFRAGTQDHARALPVTVGVGIRPIWAKGSFAELLGKSLPHTPRVASQNRPPFLPGLRPGSHTRNQAAVPLWATRGCPSPADAAPRLRLRGETSLAKPSLLSPSAPSPDIHLSSVLASWLS